MIPPLRPRNMFLRSRTLRVAGASAATCVAAGGLAPASSSCSAGGAPLQVFNLSEIKSKTPDVPVLIDAIERGFEAYSRGDVQVAAVGHLNFAERKGAELYGDCCIKSGMIYGDDKWVVKVATGNWNHGPNGAMLVLKQSTGQVLAVLADEGFLTDLRTAVAGAVAAKWMAPAKVTALGVLGTGVQARLQVVVWGRSEASLQRYKKDMEKEGFTVRTTSNPGDVAASCNLIVTCTPSREPLLTKSMIRPGTHLTCVGADVKGKGELDTALVASASCLADSQPQCTAFGELSKAVDLGLVDAGAVREIGQAITEAKSKGLDRVRAGDEEVTIFDSTGVAVQDVVIATMVHSALAGGN